MKNVRGFSRTSSGLCGPKSDGRGDVAQLGERLVRNEKVGGSIPLISTIILASQMEHYDRTVQYWVKAIAVNCSAGQLLIFLSSWRDGRAIGGSEGAGPKGSIKNKIVINVSFGQAHASRTECADCNGEMAERSKAHAWKACRLQKGLKGSNPFLSATLRSSSFGWQAIQNACTRSRIELEVSPEALAKGDEECSCGTYIS